MPCSAYTLSLATIAAVISVALIAIAFSTDNWSRINVDRIKLEVNIDLVLVNLIFLFIKEWHFCVV